MRTRVRSCRRGAPTVAAPPALVRGSAGPWLAVVMLLAAAQAHAEQVVLQPVRDTTLFENLAGAVSNGSGPNLFAGDNSNGNTRRALLAFAIATALPAGAHVDAVELRLFLSNAPDTVNTSVALYRVRSSWGEGASMASGGTGAPSEPGDATWVHRFYPDTRWLSPGGDFDGIASTAFGVRLLGPYVVSSPRMAADVQSWLDQPATDHGWMLQGEEEVASSARRFDSREHPDPSHRPTLVVHFTPTPVTPVTWGQVKSSFKD